MEDLQQINEQTYLTLKTSHLDFKQAVPKNLMTKNAGLFQWWVIPLYVEN